jgi:hypothetical protein
MQRLQLQVDDSGQNSAPEFIYDPNCCGWEVSFRTTQQNGMWVMLTASVRDKFEGGPPAQTVGPFFATTGGKIFIPFSTVSFQGLDMVGAGIGNTSTVDIVVRAIGPGEDCSSETKVIGGIINELVGNAEITEAVPQSAQAYQVTCAGPAAHPGIDFALDFTGLARISRVIVDPNLVQENDTGGQRWRPIPGGPCEIELRNNSALVNINVFIFFEFDFARVN